LELRVEGTKDYEFSIFGSSNCFGHLFYAFIL
jgi:hypothetical protein